MKHSEAERHSFRGIHLCQGAVDSSFVSDGPPRGQSRGRRAEATIRVYRVKRCFRQNLNAVFASVRQALAGADLQTGPVAGSFVGKSPRRIDS